MTALLLREQGHAVHGALMSVRDASGRGCGAPGDTEAAAALASGLGIPFTVFDCSQAYREVVLGNFRAEYLAGRTPNPCVLCNPNLKFTLLPRLAREAGIDFDFFATGHYARIEYSAELNRHVLLRGVDTGKDQSYFLYRLGADLLARVRFPVGKYTKTVIRGMAKERGVPVFDKPDSQDFYGGDYAELLGVAEAEGEIVDTRGKVLGKHPGYWRFTPGQRKGLGIAFSEPLYVIRIEPERNCVVVGTRDEELSRGCIADNLVFPDGLPEAGASFLGRIRSAQPLRPMRVVRAEGDEIAVEFDERLQGVAPGQALVLYTGDMVVGGGVIKAALP